MRGARRGSAVLSSKSWIITSTSGARLNHLPSQILRQGRGSYIDDSDEWMQMYAMNFETCNDMWAET